MAKKKRSLSSIIYIQNQPRKRPGRHAKSYNKRLPQRKQKQGQGD